FLLERLHLPELLPVILLQRIEAFLVGGVEVAALLVEQVLVLRIEGLVARITAEEDVVDADAELREHLEAVEAWIDERRLDDLDQLLEGHSQSTREGF